MDSSFLSNGFCKMGKVERKKWNEKSGTEKHYESITAIKKKIKMVFGFVIFQPCKIGS